MKTYLYDYFYDGKRWSLEIAAHSKEDADAILKTLPLAHYTGELQFKIPAFGGNWIANLIIWWKGRINK
jgi:hypothetical protein